MASRKSGTGRASQTTGSAEPKAMTMATRSGIQRAGGLLGQAERLVWNGRAGRGLERRGRAIDDDHFHQVFLSREIRPG